MKDGRFIKMHGLGNDFVVLDTRESELSLSAPQAAAIADRQRGVGCDQVILIERSATELADAGLVFLNADGSESAACGNGTRCAASLLMAENGTDHVTLETAHGLLDCDAVGDLVTVDMGVAQTEWRDIPLAQASDTLHLGLEEGPLSDPVGVGMGNPHMVFFVEDADSVALETLGPILEHHALYPERANVQVVQVLGRDRIRQRTWERGSGITLASGSGACAGAVAACRRNLTDRKVDVVMNGGTLTIEWLESGQVLMTGPVATSFTGHLDDSLLQV